MKALLIAGIITVAAFAQTAPSTGEADRVRPPEQQKPQIRQIRRLESVSWNPMAGELIWVVSKMTADTNTKDTYVIRVGEALMKFEGERRGFDPREARSVQSLLDLLSRYAVESTIWWEEGEGVKLDDKGDPKLKAFAEPMGRPAPERVAQLRPTP